MIQGRVWTTRATTSSRSMRKTEADRANDVCTRKGASRKLTPAYSAIVKQDGTIQVNPVVLEYGTDKYAAGDVRQVPVSGEMVAELYEWARKRLGLDLGLRYWKRRAGNDETENHVLTKLALYALAAAPGHFPSSADALARS